MNECSARLIWNVAAVAACLGCSPFVVEAFAPEPPPEPCPDGSEPGVCGCGIVPDDFDGDGTPDCVDECPDNAQGITPSGPCGCSTFADTAACGALRAAIRNLYTFAGSDTTVVDSVGDQDGVVSHTDANMLPEQLAQLQRDGRLRLDGQGAYVALPGGMISSSSSATFEAWVVWQGDEVWSRIFDFGNNGGDPVEGVTYLFLTPVNVTTETLRVAYSLGGPLQETQIQAESTLTTQSGAPGSVPDHVAVVIDATDASMRLYLNGVQVGQVVTLPGDLTAINDVNNWLGRSNYQRDPALFGTFIEFRVYGQALSAAELQASFQAGPGALD
jgi:hypothetical protein